MKLRRMSYVEGYSTMIICVGPNGISVPKDGQTDGYRLLEALQEKLPFREDGALAVDIFPIPLQSAIAKMSPHIFLGFEQAWERREPQFTTRRWGECFQTMGKQYIKGDDCRVLELGKVEHYYNIVLTRYEKALFEKVNPCLRYEPCNAHCLPLTVQKPHFHAVHGYYPGAMVGEDHCPPPMRLIPAWAAIPAFTLEEIRTVVPATEYFKVNDDKRYAEAKKLESEGGYRLGDGAQVLASFCYNDGEDAEWSNLCEVYRSPHSALWASVLAHYPTTAGQRKIRKRWNEKFQAEILPMLQGQGTPILTVIEKVWKLDDTSAKTVASYMMRRLFAGTEGVIYDYGCLRI
jgi:hypothetical protein